MSNHKEKAKQLVEKFKLEPIKPLCIMHPQHSKQCAIIAVDEILKSHDYLVELFRETEDYIKIETYWIEVKNEIEKL